MVKVRTIILQDNHQQKATVNPRESGGLFTPLLAITRLPMVLPTLNVEQNSDRLGEFHAAAMPTRVPFESLEGALAIS